MLAAPRAWGREAATPARIGFLSPVAPGSRDRAFLQGLAELGYVHGRDILVEMRFAEGRPERLSPLVRELLELRVDVLVAGATIGARTAKEATATVPIVFAGSSDPVAGGIVTSLARPGGNVTGFSTAFGDRFAGKWLELIREAAPGVTQVAVLWSSSNAAAMRFVEELRSAAKTAKVALHVHHAANAGDLDRAFVAIGSQGARALIVTPSPFAVSQRGRLVRYAAANRLPAIYFDDSFVEAGGLMSYGPSIADTYRRAAGHVDKILKGARPGDLPVELPTRFELVVNRGTARALGIAPGQALLIRVDRFVE